MKEIKNSIGFEFASGINWNDVLYSKLFVVNHKVDRWKKQIRTSARVSVIDDCSENNTKSRRSIYMDHRGPYLMSSSKFFHNGYRQKVYIRVPDDCKIKMENRLKEVETLLKTN